jgi:hypothetical protein
MLILLPVSLAVALVAGELYKGLRIHPAWLVAIGIGVILVYEGFTRLRPLYNVREWPRVTGLIVSSTIKEQDLMYLQGHPAVYAPDIAFSYDASEEKRTSGHFSADSDGFWFHQRQRAVELKNKYPDGAAVDVFVCPANPSFAVLNAELDPKRRSHFLALLVGGLLLLMVDAAGIFWSLK